jgi:hypothetical protein
VPELLHIPHEQGHLQAIVSTLKMTQVSGTAVKLRVPTHSSTHQLCPPPLIRLIDFSEQLAAQEVRMRKVAENLDGVAGGVQGNGVLGG